MSKMNKMPKCPTCEANGDVYEYSPDGEVFGFKCDACGWVSIKVSREPVLRDAGREDFHADL